MAQIDLYRGGVPQTVFPACEGQNQFRPPFPHRVAGEYGRGDFTLGFALHPAVIGWQADKLLSAAVGDVVNVLVVPEHHVVASVFVENNPTPELSSVHAVGGCSADSMVGTKFEVVYQLYDNATFAPIGTATTAVTIADGNVYDAQYKAIAAAAQFVPTGQTMLVGVKLTAAPTATGASFAKMAGRLSVVAKVQDFQAPWIL